MAKVEITDQGLVHVSGGTAEDIERFRHDPAIAKAVLLRQDLTPLLCRLLLEGRITDEQMRYFGGHEGCMVDG